MLAVERGDGVGVLILLARCRARRCSDIPASNSPTISTRTSAGRQRGRGIGAAHQREAQRRAVVRRAGGDGRHERWRLAHAARCVQHGTPRRTRSAQPAAAARLQRSGLLGAHEFGGGAARHLRAMPAFRRCSNSTCLANSGFARQYSSKASASASPMLSRDVLFDLFLIHKPRLRRSRFAKPRSSRICRNRRRARLSAWLNAASVKSSS